MLKNDTEYQAVQLLKRYVCGLSIWAQIFLMPDRYEQQPKK